MRPSFLPLIFASLLSLTGGMELRREVFVDTYITPLNKHIHLDHIFRHSLGVFTGDYYNNHRHNGETLQEEKRTIWNDDFFTFMWLPQEVAIVGDSAIYASHQMNESPPPFCAIMKYNLNDMYPYVGRFDALPKPSGSRNEGFYNILVDEKTGQGYLVGDGKVIYFNTTGSFSSFGVTQSYSFRASAPYFRALLSNDKRFIFFTNSDRLEKFDIASGEIVDSLRNPGDSRRGDLRRLVADPEGKYAISLTYRSYVREFPNVTYECFLIKYDLENFDIVTYTEHEDCYGADLKSGFSVIEPTGKYLYLGASTDTRIASTDSIVKVDLQTLKPVERLELNYELKHFYFDRDNQALAVGTQKGTRMDDQYILVIDL